MVSRITAGQTSLPGVVAVAARQAALTAVATQPPAVAASATACATAVRAGGVVGSTAAAGGATAAAEEMLRLQQLLHIQPGCSTRLWYLLSLVSLQWAEGLQQCRAYRKALAVAVAADKLVAKAMTDHPETKQQAAAEPAAAPALPGILGIISAVPSISGLSLGSSGAPLGSAAGDTQTQPSLDSEGLSLGELLTMRVRLLVSISESHLRSRRAGGLEAGHQAAMEALTLALSPSSRGLKLAPLAQRQVARAMAAEGMVSEAEMGYRQALMGGDTVAVLELAMLLQERGRGREALPLLKGTWQPLASSVLSGVGEKGVGGQEVGVGGGEMLESLMLVQGLLLLKQRDWEGAKGLVLGEGMKVAGVVKDYAPVAAQLIAADAALHQAAAAEGAAAADGGGGMEGTGGGGGGCGEVKAALQEARRWASAAIKSAMALPGSSGMSAAGVAAAVLAEVERRRGQLGKAGDALQMSSASWWPAPVPGEVMVAVGQLTGEGGWAAKGVHVAPWLKQGWEQLQR